jgi:murein DD-endopeptidase MepM/ murein hydrolase activator NlpD
MAGGKPFYTILFVPSDRGRTISFRLHRNILRSLIFFVVTFALGLLFLLLSTGKIAIKLQLVHSLTQEKERLEKENRNLTHALERVNKLQSVALYLQNLAIITGDTALRAPSPSQPSRPQQSSLQRPEAAPGAGSQPFSGKRSEAASMAADGMIDATPSIRPVEGWVTKRFSLPADDQTSPHLGIDLAAAEGTPIRATAPGIVDTVYNDRYFGLIIALKHSRGFETRYGHCSQILVAKGGDIKRGQTIGLVGNTGRSSAPHLHYEILKDGKPVDPMKYIFTGVYP